MRSDPHGNSMNATTDLGCIGPHHLETYPMSTLARRADPSYRWSGLPPTRIATPYFVLGQDSQGLWVIRESTGKKGGVFKSRQAALLFARMESPNGNFTVVHVNETVELDDAA
jgi:hypothetical protein